MTKLNTRQRLVLINALAGMNQTDAYEKVYGHSSATYKCASELFNKPHFNSELQLALQRKEEILTAQDVNIITAGQIDAVLTKAEKRAILADVLRNGQPTTETHYNRKIEGQPGITATMTRRDIIEAIREDNKMSGDYAPSKHLVAQRVIFEVTQVEHKKRGEE